MASDHTIRTDFGEFDKQLGVSRADYLTAARRGVLVSMIHAAKRTVDSKLLGQVLHRRTGTLIRSILASSAERNVRASGDVVRGTIGSNLDYAKFHEYGFKGTVRVREHLRRRLGKPLAQDRFTLRVTKRGKARAGGPITVRAHDRKVNYAGRPYLRPTMQQEEATVRKILRATFVATLELKRVPTQAEIMARAGNL